MSNLAIYNVSGCFGSFPSGNIGQILVQGANSPEWASATNIPIVDVGNYFTADNIEQALQQIGAQLAGVGGGFDCEFIQDCVGSGMHAVWGVDYDDVGNAFKLTLNSLPGISQPLSSINYFVVTGDPAWPFGSQASLAQVAAAVSGAGAASPWGKVGSGQPNQTDPIFLTDAIYHTGQMVRGAAALTANMEMENRGNFGNGAGNHSVSGDNNILSGSTNVATGNQLTVLGYDNSIAGTISSVNSSILGGNHGRIITSDNAVVVAGFDNSINTSARGFVGGGQNNGMLNSQGAAIVAGLNNSVNAANRGVIGGGTHNTLNQDDSFIGAGQDNNSNSIQGFIGAGLSNINAASWGFIGAGQSNNIQNTGQWGAIVAGQNNVNNGPHAFMGAGLNNIVADARSVIAGGARNEINSQTPGPNVNNANDSFIGAGADNWINSQEGFIGSGNHNSVLNAPRSFVGGGNNNGISGGSDSFIGGGAQNSISNGVYNFIGGGFQNSIIGASILGGVALGSKARVVHAGAFVWQSWTGAAAFSSVRPDEMALVAAGGFRLRSNAAGTIGVDLVAGSNSWVAASSAALKGHLEKLDPRSILSRLVRVPIQSYRFKRQTINEETNEVVEDGYHDELNFGPTAEDWNFEFADVLGEKTIQREVNGEIVHTPAISDGDKLGVALAAIQGLHSIVDDLKREIARLNQKVDSLAGAQPA